MPLSYPFLSSHLLLHSDLTHRTPGLKAQRSGVSMLTHHYLCQGEKLLLKIPNHVKSNCSVSIHQDRNESFALSTQNSTPVRTALQAMAVLSIRCNSVGFHWPLNIFNACAEKFCSLSTTRQGEKSKRINYTQINTVDACIFGTQKYSLPTHCQPPSPPLSQCLRSPAAFLVLWSAAGRHSAHLWNK